jgi:glutaredoxin 3
MNLAYFRESTFSYEETLKNVKKEAEKASLKILGEADLPNNQGKLFNICNEFWMSNILTVDKNLIGLLPCSLVVLKKDKKVLVGTSTASLLGKVIQDKAIFETARNVDKTLKELVNNACGVGPLTVKKIKLYATTTCPYCKMEASWLDSQKVKYDHVLVDLNPYASEEMVRKTGQMGVPVTEIVYDNGEKEYIVGFDREKLSEILQVKS